MIVSMTGYGKAVAELPGRKLTVEAKSLNSKGLDISLKLPSTFRERENEIRNLLSQRLERGKIEVYISAEVSGDLSGYTINRALAKKYYHELHDLMAELNEEGRENVLGIILRMPEVIQTERFTVEEQDWQPVWLAILEAVDQLNNFRIHEGDTLMLALTASTGIILDKLLGIEPFEKLRIEEIRERIRGGFRSLAQSDKAPVIPDENRFEQELIYYLEKLDITEEKVRLKKHCDYFLETIQGNTSQGKKLGFIAQEMGREINTIGSKANHAEIQKRVVEMKDELEKIKEQLLNIL